MPYVKLDVGILDSTLWVDKDAREIFITALLMASPKEFEKPQKQLAVDALRATGFTAPAGWYGFVPAAGPGIVRRSGCDDKAGMEALKRLGSTEAGSRSSSFGGRRLIRIDGGYLVLNYIAYRDKDHSAANRMRRYRERRRNEAGVGDGVTSSSDGVTSRNITEAEAEAEAIKKRTVAALPLPGWLSVDNWNAWVKTRPVKARSPEALKAALKKLDKFRAAGHDPNEIVANSLANGWRGLFEPDKKKGSPAAIGTCCSCGNPLTRGWTNTDKGRMCGPCYKTR